MAVMMTRRESKKRIGPPYRKQAERTPVMSPPIPSCPNRTGSTAILSSRALPKGTFWLSLLGVPGWPYRPCRVFQSTRTKNAGNDNDRAGERPEARSNTMCRFLITKLNAGPPGGFLYEALAADSPLRLVFMIPLYCPSGGTIVPPS